MVKKGRLRKSVAHQAKSLNSDDDNDADSEKEPDQNDDSYYYDEVDQFHMERDKILLDKGAPVDRDDIPSEQEEVLAFDDSDSDDEDDEEYLEMKHRLKQLRHRGLTKHLGSDMEDEPEKDTGKDEREKAWGSKRSRFYGGHESDIDEDLSDSEPEAAILEEEEALTIQKRLLQEMDEGDVGLDMFKPAESSEASTSEKVARDLTKMSQREKQQLLKKQSPELLELIEDYEKRVNELQSRLLPIYKLIRERKLSKYSNGAMFITSKVHIYLNYLINFGYYLMLKAKQTPIEYHPVIKRLLQYRNIIKQADALDVKFKPAVDAILERIKQNKEFSSAGESSEAETPAVEQTKPVFKSRLLNKKKKISKLIGTKRLFDMLNDSDLDEANPNKTLNKKRGKLDVDMNDAEVKPDSEINSANEAANEPGLSEEEKESEKEEMERRGINYQIEKNKGLIVRKKKELRNPRVKNRLKYRKAKIRRRGQVREVRKEIDKYEGEISGIRAGIKKSIKFKS